MQMAELINAKKSLPLHPSWLIGDNDRVSIVSPLDIDGVTIEGLRMRATAIVTRVDECVTFQIEYLPPGGEIKGGPLTRIDWKPLAAHNNKSFGPAMYRNKIITASHYHSFALNWNEEGKAMRKGNLPIAIPLLPEPQTFERLVDLVRQEFNIVNIDWLQLPPWQATLL